MNVNLEEGVARSSAIMPGKFSYSADGLLGYSFATGSSDVPAGDEPLELTIPVIAAGGIAGQVLNADGTPAGSGVSIGLRDIERPAALAGQIAVIRTRN